jgi:hypothetical protein
MILLARQSKARRDCLRWSSVSGGEVVEDGEGGEGGGDFGVAVADGDGVDAAKAVEVAATGFVEEVLHFAFDGHEGVFVE